MDILGEVVNAAPFWAPVAVLAVIALAILRFRRWRSLSAEKHSSGPFPLETEVDLLDSSHIGLAPLGSAHKRPEQPLERPSTPPDPSTKRR